MDDNILEMSDEDFEKMVPPDFSEISEEDSEDDVETPEKEEGDDKGEEIEEQEEGAEGSEEEAEEEDVEPTDGEPEEKEEEKELEPEEKEETEEGAKKEEEPFDYKAAYENVMKPFKVNGEDMAPQSPEDLIKLAQIGASSGKKMEGMRPALKALKTLENNELLKEGELDFLIDVRNGDPLAIAKLLKDKGINPLEMDMEAETDYVPQDHTSITDTELDLDEAINTVMGTPNGDRTLTTVTKEWDETSRIAVASDPQIITHINEQMDSGVYDKIMPVLKYEKSMGRLKGFSDFDAYKAVGEQLAKQGAFDAPVEKVVPVKLPPKVNKEAEKQRIANKKSASPSKSKGKVPKVAKDFNPLSLSDEDFAKLDPKTLGINI